MRIIWWHKLKWFKFHTWIYKLFATIKGEERDEIIGTLKREGLDGYGLAGGVEALCFAMDNHRSDREELLEVLKEVAAIPTRKDRQSVQIVNCVAKARTVVKRIEGDDDEQDSRTEVI